jgi:hypothetical protein
MVWCDSISHFLFRESNGFINIRHFSYCMLECILWWASFYQSLFVWFILHTVERHIGIISHNINLQQLVIEYNHFKWRLYLYLYYYHRHYHHLEIHPQPNYCIVYKMWIQTYQIRGQFIFLSVYIYIQGESESLRQTLKCDRSCRDIYKHEMNYSFISSSMFADSLQKVFRASAPNLITFITPS